MSRGKTGNKENKNNSGKPLPHPIHIKRYAWVLIIVWTAVVAASISWYIFEEKKTVFEAARIQARIAYEKDVIYRLSALHKIYSKEGI